MLLTTHSLKIEAIPAGAFLASVWKLFFYKVGCVSFCELENRDNWKFLYPLDFSTNKDFEALKTAFSI